MERREFLKLTPALAATVPAASLVWTDEHGIEQRLSIGVLQLEPGDTIVVSSVDRMSPEGMRNLQVILERLFPGHRVAVLDQGLSIGVLRGA